MIQIMKNLCHGALESGTSILEAKRHDTISKITPRGSECSFVLIGWVNLNLFGARESIHKGEIFMAGAIVDNLIDEWRWEIVFWTSIVEIAKVGANVNGALFFVDGYRVGNPRSVSDGVNEPGRAQFVNFGFDSHGLGWV